MKTIKKIKLGQLVFDEKLLSLRPINSFVVSRYRQSYRSGAIFPPLVIEEKTNRITSGNQRATAMLKEYGPDHKVEVVAKKYAGEKELLEDFVAENIKHGFPIDGASRARIAIALLNEGASEDGLAKLFNVPGIKSLGILETGRSRMVPVLCIGGDGKEEVQELPVKRCGPKVTQAITQKQYEEHRQSDVSVPTVQLAGQLIRHLENGWVERKEGTLVVLGTLHEALGVFLKEGQPEKVVGQ